VLIYLPAKSPVIALKVRNKLIEHFHGLNVFKNGILTKKKSF